MAESLSGGFLIPLESVIKGLASGRRRRREDSLSLELRKKIDVPCVSCIDVAAGLLEARDTSRVELIILHVT